MKKTLQFVVLAFCLCLLVSCQSKEEKAAEFIKTELSKTLYDFDSYQPIETIVTEARMNMYNDSACWIKAAAMVYFINKASDFMKDYKEAKEHMEIWGKPTRYSSNYSDNKYYKYKIEAEENFEKAKITYDLCKSTAAELREMIANLDTVKVIGWDVRHKFRCKTKGGTSTIEEYRFVLDKDFKKVLLQEDVNNDSAIRNVYKTVLQGYFDEEKK